MKKIKINIDWYACLLLILLLLDSNFLYLINTDTIHLFGISYLDIFLFIKLLIILFALIINLKSKINFEIIIFLFGIFLLFFIGSFSACISYRQSILEGIVAQRYWLTSMLMCIPFFFWLKASKISIKTIHRCLFIYCSLYLFVCIVQYFLSKVIVFTYSPNDGSSRYDGSRYYFEYGVLILTALISLNYFFNNFKIRFLFIPIFTLFFCLVILKARMTSIAYICSILTMSFISKLDYKKKTFVILVCIIGIFIFFNTKMGKDVIATIFNLEDSNNTLTIRNKGRNFYLTQLLSSANYFLFGLGVANIHNQNAQLLSGSLSRIYVVDNGIFGSTFQYGFIGLIMWMIIMLVCLRYAYVIYKKKNNLFYVSFIVFDVIGFITIQPLFWRTNITFPLFFSLIVFEREKIKNKEIFHEKTRIKLYS